MENKGVSITTNPIFIYVTVLFMTTGCNLLPNKNEVILIPTDNNGGYQLKEYNLNRGESSDSIIIFGSVNSIISKKPLPASFVKWGCLTEITDGSGNFKISISRNIDVPLRLSASSMLYQEIITREINIKDYDSLRIDFHLDLSRKSFPDCN
ncbi:hypothetical protein [Roseivirga sp.]|uniref:hypothetical protein n=1 Tax=Roseivirga sp. TaxID=1964215 RepID=UPI003B51B80F